MILTADIRGNGHQLAHYSVEQKDNDHVQILEVDGREDAKFDYLYQTVMSMEYNCELTKADMAFYHAQISPAYGEDKKMTREDWYKAADILAKETGFENQRRVITLHTKKNRTHAHVIWERYNHETGKVIDNKNSRIKANNARGLIEQALGHKPTPRRSTVKPELRKTILKIWNETTTGADFIKQARKAGYMIAEGRSKRPFMIVDGTGRSFDLVRQLDGVRTKEVRARLRHEKLTPEKRAIEIMREEGEKSGKREKQKIELKPIAVEKAKAFAANRFDALTPDEEIAKKRLAEKIFNKFRANAEAKANNAPTVEHEEQQRKETVAREFAENNLSGKEQQNEAELKRQKIIEQQELIKQRNRQHKRHR